MMSMWICFKVGARLAAVVRPSGTGGCFDELAIGWVRGKARSLPFRVGVGTGLGLGLEVLLSRMSFGVLEWTG
jgi:hypothetical protein